MRALGHIIVLYAAKIKKTSIWIVQTLVIYLYNISICVTSANIVLTFIEVYGLSPLGDIPPRARKPISNKVRWRIFARDNFTCQKCGETGVELTIDHKIALANGGADDEANFQTLCRSCNCSKGAHL